MELLLNLNWLSIVLSSIVYFLLGGIWYTVLFGKKWVRYQKIDLEDPNAKKDAGRIMMISFLMMFLLNSGIAILIFRIQPVEILSGLKIGILTGVCFTACGISISYLYVKKPLALHLIDCGYHIIGNILSACILVNWQ
ncbi:MAG TPA: DUF1761 domain-containing protein [Flavisolibacter sp.]|jgi:hypothetical protein|nr:DUF1761 domain-containing protein [Flavisolibacter sp.]